MGVGGQHRQGEALRPLGTAGVEVGHRDPEPPRVAAHVAQRHQPGVAVEGRVLDPLGDHGRSGLLKAGHELRRCRTVQQQHLGDLHGHAGGGDDLAI